MDRKHEYSNLIKISNQQRDGILSQLDQKSEGFGDADNRREDRRWAYRVAPLRVEFEHPGGGFSRVLVAARNLSAGGTGFLHGGFVYPGSRCCVILERLDGVLVPNPGTVVACRHISGALHEIGVKFDRRIDPRTFHREALRDGGALERVELGDMSGVLLCLDESPLDQKLLAHQLRPTNMTVHGARTPEEMRDTIGKETIDIVFSEVVLGNLEAETLIKAIREAGFRGPIALVTAETDADRLAAARDAGVAYVLPKPIDTTIMFAMLSEMHLDVGAAVSNDQLFSSQEDDPSMLELIEEYISQVSELSGKLSEHMTANDTKQVRDICLSLKGSAPGYGFAPVSDAASHAVKMLDATASIDESRAQLRALMLMCGRMSMRKQ